MGFSILQIMKVKKWMTEILLEVTSQETEAVAKEVYYKARNNAAKGIRKHLAQDNIQNYMSPEIPISLASSPQTFYHRHFRWKVTICGLANILNYASCIQQFQVSYLIFGKPFISVEFNQILLGLRTRLKILLYLVNKMLRNIVQ